MTAQLPDKPIYTEKAYDIIGIMGTGLPTPQDFGLAVGMWHTACWRGYISTFTCINRDLFLTELHIGRVADETNWVLITGVEPQTQYS